MLSGALAALGGARFLAALLGVVLLLGMLLWAFWGARKRAEDRGSDEAKLRAHRAAAKAREAQDAAFDKAGRHFDRDVDRLVRKRRDDAP